MVSKQLKHLYEQHYETALFGRYITQQMIAPLLGKHKNNFEISVLGHSVLKQPIHSVKFGNGNTKILLWSQMHGNESTTTKALFDLLNVVSNKEDVYSAIIEKCTFLIIPMLNPDGAENYTRLNANNVDLNRDAQQLSQPESKVLRHVFDNFKPNYCFNLHGQRTIFGVGDTNVSASLSFLAPSEDAERLVTETRKKAMSVIVAINKGMQGDLPGAISRYDDGFNINCVGDTFQVRNVPTILFEAGHYKNDYHREKTRFFIFKSLYYAFNSIANGLETYRYDQYFNIPENKKSFCDFVITNVRLNKEDKSLMVLAIQFKEVLIDNVLHFIPFVESIATDKLFFGHKEIDAEGAVVLDHNNKMITEGNEIDFVMLNNRKILLKP